MVCCEYVTGVTPVPPSFLVGTCAVCEGNLCAECQPRRIIEILRRSGRRRGGPTPVAGTGGPGGRREDLQTSVTPVRSMPGNCRSPESGAQRYCRNETEWRRLFVDRE